MAGVKIHLAIVLSLVFVDQDTLTVQSFTSLHHIIVIFNYSWQELRILLLSLAPDIVLLELGSCQLLVLVEAL